MRRVFVLLLLGFSTLSSYAQNDLPKFPLEVTIDGVHESDANQIAEGQKIQAASIGIAIPYFVFFSGTINAESHWVFSCHKENAIREVNPCTPLALGTYKGRWVHDYNVLQIVGGNPEVSRILHVGINAKNAPGPDDPVLHIPVTEFMIQFPKGKDVQNYPILIHVYGGVQLDQPIAEIPAKTRCKSSSSLTGQTNTNCKSYPATTINSRHVSLEADIGKAILSTITCIGGHCVMLDPGFYYARADRDHLVILTQDNKGRATEIKFSLPASEEKRSMSLPN